MYFGPNKSNTSMLKQHMQTPIPPQQQHTYNLHISLQQALHFKLQTHAAAMSCAFN